jgi:DNA-binding CsgD family transcriptional regulator
MLTNREQECATWIVNGKTSWEIAQILGISENTVNFHVKNIMRKLNCNTRALIVARLLSNSYGNTKEALYDV